MFDRKKAVHDLDERSLAGRMDYGENVRKQVKSVVMVSEPVKFC